MCRKAHLVLKPAGCRIAVICGRCISAYVVVCGRCIVHRLCSTTCKLPCLATLCDRIRHPCLFVSALFAWHRATLCALTFRHPCLTRLCGFSHPHSNTQKAKTVPKGYGLRFLVPVAGVEPARYCYQRILSPSRLPIPSHRRILLSNRINIVIFRFYSLIIIS